MDYYEFFTENNEFKIVLKKRKRMYGASQFANYLCSIEFKDCLDNSIVTIESTESVFLKFIQDLNDFITNFGQIISNNLYFPDHGNGYYYFFYIAMNPEVDYPAEDDDKIYLSLFESSIYGQVLRLSLETSIFWIEEFIYSLFQILEDIPYLDHLSTTTLLEYMDYSELMRPY